MTTDSREFVDRIIKGNGWLPEHGDHGAPDNPPVVRIVEYTNMAGRRAWGCEFPHEVGKYRETEWVRNPVVIWTQPEGAS